MDERLKDPDQGFCAREKAGSPRALLFFQLLARLLLLFAGRLTLFPLPPSDSAFAVGSFSLTSRLLARIGIKGKTGLVRGLG
ncbi:MAG: hypothetical protein KKE57_08465 [Proteobacteria bacterium]|nr:hypothetical protein [Pseudomonadota bacterium]